MLVALELRAWTGKFLGGPAAFVMDCRKTSCEDGFADEGDGLTEVKSIAVHLPVP